MHFFLDAYKLILAALIVLAVLVHAVAVRAEELHDHTKMGSAGEFYSKWNRPKANFSGISHRAQSCCNRQDCSPVGETRMVNGQYEVRPDLPDGTLGNWYRVDPSVPESVQPDPRESPDGRSHVCIIGGMAVCFVEGGGM